MTPAINSAKKHKISYTVHQYEHGSSTSSFGEEAVEKTGVAAERVFKTLVVSTSGGELAVGIVPVSESLNTKALAKALGCKNTEMADKQKVSRVTGYVLGGVSPLGQKKKLATVIDISAKNHPTIFVSAGRRGLEIELAPDDLLTACSASYADIAAG